MHSHGPETISIFWHRTHPPLFCRWRVFDWITTKRAYEVPKWPLLDPRNGPLWLFVFVKGSKWIEGSKKWLFWVPKLTFFQKDWKNTSSKKVAQVTVCHFCVISIDLDPFWWPELTPPGPCTHAPARHRTDPGPLQNWDPAHHILTWPATPFIVVAKSWQQQIMKPMPIQSNPIQSNPNPIQIQS